MNDEQSTDRLYEILSGLGPISSGRGRDTTPAQEEVDAVAALDELLEPFAKEADERNDRISRYRRKTDMTGEQLRDFRRNNVKAARERYMETRTPEEIRAHMAEISRKGVEARQGVRQREKEKLAAANRRSRAYRMLLKRCHTAMYRVTRAHTLDEAQTAVLELLEGPVGRIFRNYHSFSGADNDSGKKSVKNTTK